MIIFHRFLIFLLSSFLLAWVCPPVLAQDAEANPPRLPVIHIARTELSHFDTALNALSEQAHVAIICEEQPRQDSLSDADRDALFTQINSGEGPTVESTVKAIATVFGYETERHSPVLFLLNKSYHDAEDLPVVSLAEVTESLGNIHKALELFYSGEYNAELLWQIKNSLSAEEKASFAAGVPVQSLPPQQQQWIRRFAFNTCFHQMENVDRVLRRLKACRSDKTVFTKREYFGAELPLYEGPFTLNGIKSEVVLSGWVMTQSGGGIVFEGGDEASLTDNRLVSKGVDPTTPTLKGSITAATQRRYTRSLADIADQANGQIKPGQNATKMAVAASISTKRVVLIGAEYATPEEVFRGIAQLYGLSLRPSVGNALRLSLPSARIVRRLQDIGPEIARLLPKPFVRYLRAIPGQTLYTNAVRELRRIVEPEIERRPKKTLPMSEAGERARGLVALSSLATCDADLRQLQRNAPPFLDHLDQASFKLIVGQPDSPNSIGFSLMYEGEDGVTSGISGDIAYSTPQ